MGFAGRFFLLAGCAQQATAPQPQVAPTQENINNPPVVEDISYVQSISSRSSMEIRCRASDKDGDPLKYQWWAETGQLKGEGPVVSWTALDNEGNYLVSVKVSDDKGASVEKSLIIEVRMQEDDKQAGSDLARISLVQSLANGKPTLAEFGWKFCIPCKAMKPILESIAADYADKLNVVIVEVYDPANEKYAVKYGIESIPTQIFFDKNSKEVYRHIGFISKAARYSSGR